MAKKWCLLVLIVLLFSAPLRLFGAAIPDGFNLGLTPADGTFFLVALQSDGKILLGGQVAGSPTLARYFPDGTPDATFTPPTFDSNNLWSILPLSDGKILITGEFTMVDGAPQAGLVRLNPDGTRDMSFVSSLLPSWGLISVDKAAELPDGSLVIGGLFSDGGGDRGIARLLPDGSFDPQFLGRADGEIETLAVQKDGKIVVGGWFLGINGTSQECLARLNADGTLDAAFAPAVSDEVNTLALEDDGGILIAGVFTMIDGVSYNKFARLNKSGNADSSFQVAVDDPNALYPISSIVVQSDGKIVIGGGLTVLNGTPSGLLVRLDRNGAVDTAFAPTLEANREIRSIALQADGNLLVAGSFTTPRYNVARFYANGVLDQDSSVNFTQTSSGVWDQFILPDGELVIGGYILDVNGTTRHRIARLKSDWSLDTGFNPDLNSRMLATVPLPDGRYLVGGNFWWVNGGYLVGIQQYCLAIFDPTTGTLDPTFRPDFKYTPQTVFTEVSAIAVQPDGKLLIGGKFDQVNGEAVSWLVRLDLSGNIDHTFNPPPLDAQVYSIVQLPDKSMIIAGSFTGKIKHLDQLGTPDAAFNSRLPVIRYAANDDAVPRGAPLPVYQLIPTADGKYIAVGIFDDPLGGAGTPNGNILRLNGDGSLDPTFRVLTTLLYGETLTAITGGALQADGRLVLFGRFSTVMVNGVTYSRDCIFRVNADGTIDQEFTPTVQAAGVIPTDVYTVNLQPDGKMLIGGNFVTFNGVARSYLVRLQNGRASDTLTVSGDGTEVRWMRSGTSAELWRVAVEESSDGTTWNWIGDATRIAGGWSLSGLNFPPRHNHYLRAKGYATVGDRHMNGTIYQPVRMYTVNRLPQTITFPEIPLKLPTSPDFDPGATASSSLPVTYRSSDPSVATIVNGMVHLMGVPGTALITAMQDGNETYEPAPNVSRVVTTTQLNQTIHFLLPPKSWGDPDFNAGATTTSGLTIGYTSSDPTVATVSGGVIHITGTGSTTITASQGGSDVYFPAAPVPATLTVAKALITVTAAPATKAYGDANPSFAPAYSGFVYNETAAVISGSPTFSTAADAASGAGSYDVTVAVGSLAATNYTFAATKGALTVSKRPLTVTADNQSRTYGAANPSFTYRFNPAEFVNGDTAAVVSGLPVLGTAATAATPCGSYPITVGAGTLSAANYRFTPVPGTLTVGKAVLTVTADDKSRPYGGANPSFTASYTGFLNGETTAVLSGAPLFSTAATAASGPNTYPISIGAGTLTAANYSFNPVPGTLTVSRAPLTIRADSKSKRYGDPNPALTATIIGLVNGDSEGSLGGAPGLTTTALLDSPLGSYPIVAAQGGITSQNYSYSFVNGVLTVTDGAQVIDFPPIRAKTYGDGNFTPQATATSGLPVSFTSSDPAVAAVVNGKIRVVAPGSADITASQPGDAVWDPAPDVTRTLLVHPPPWNGLGFDGVDDVVQVADAPRLGFAAAESFTLESWLHLDGPQPDYTGILSNGDQTAPFSGYQLLIYGNRIAAEIGDGSATVGVAQGLVGTSPLNDGSWHQVALVFDRAAGTAQLIFDGRIEAIVAAALSGPIQNGAGLRLGVDRSGTHFFKGALDEVRIWSAARSRDRIRAAISQIVDPLDEPALGGYFHFDEGDAGLANPLFATLPERTETLGAGILSGFALDGATSNWIASGAFLPLLETIPISNLTATSLTSGGEIYSNYYPPTDRGICWGTAPRPDLTGSCLHSGSGVGIFAEGIAGLTPGTAYHVRGFATNVMGTAYGNDISFTTNRLDQTTYFPPLPSKTYGDPDFPPGGTSSSGLPVTYTSSDPTVATVVGNDIHITGAGTTLITASQGGDGTYNPATDVVQTFSVNKAPITVRADDKARAYRTANPPLSATYSGFVLGEGMNAISGACTLGTAATEVSPVGSYDIVTGVGTLSARNYTFVLRNGVLNVIKSCQEIVFPPIGDRTYGDPPFQIVAIACSGLNLTFSSSSSNVVRINGNIITIVGAGTATVTASQSGSGDVTPAPDVSQTIVVHRSGQQLTFTTPAQKVLGDPPFPLSASASSGLPVTFKSLNPAVATVNGNIVTLTGVGTTVITATQPGDGNYDPAIGTSQPLTVAQEGVPPLVALSTLPFGAVTTFPVLNIEGLAADASEIKRLTINDRDYTGEGGLFSGAVLLTSGDNVVTVTAQDGAGNQSSDSRTVTFDASAPAIELTTPPDNGMTGTATFTITGKVAAGTSAALVLNDADPQPLAVDATGAFSWSGTLVQGVNTIRVLATRDGRTAQIKRSVALVPGAPAVAITDPACDRRTDQNSITVSGSAGGMSPLTLLLEVNGTSYQPGMSGGIFRQAIPLPTAGEYRIKATVTDGGGNTSFARRNIFRTDQIAGDLNGDGVVDVADAAVALRIALGLDPATDEAKARVDLAPVVNGVSQPDGKIDVGDVLVLLRMIVGLKDF